MKKNIIFFTVLSLFSSFNLNSEILAPQEAFFKAIDNNDIESVKKAIADGADINEVDPTTGTTSLYQILLKIDQYTNKKNIWILTAIAAAISGVLGFAGMEMSYEIHSKLKEAQKVIPPALTIEIDGSKVTLKDATEDRENSAILGGVLIISFVGLTYLTHKMKTRLKKTAQIAYLLLNNPQIKICKTTHKLLKKIIDKSNSDISNLLKINNLYNPLLRV